MRIYLRPIQLEDGMYIVKWRNSPQVISHCFDKTPVTLESNERFYKTYIETGKYRQFIVERVEETTCVVSYAIATVYLKDIDISNHCCELCIFTSDDEEWNTESQTMAIKMLLEKAFTEYDMKRVYTYVFATHQNEIELMYNSGFHKEKVLEKGTVDLNGEYIDVYLLSIVKENYKKN